VDVRFVKSYAPTDLKTMYCIKRNYIKRDDSTTASKKVNQQETLIKWCVKECCITGFLKKCNDRPEKLSYAKAAMEMTDFWDMDVTDYLTGLIKSYLSTFFVFPFVKDEALKLHRIGAATRDYHFIVGAMFDAGFVINTKMQTNTQIKNAIPGRPGEGKYALNVLEEDVVQEYQVSCFLIRQTLESMIEAASDPDDVPDHADKKRVLRSLHDGRFVPMWEYACSVIHDNLLLQGSFVWAQDALKAARSAARERLLECEKTLSRRLESTEFGRTWFELVSHQNLLIAAANKHAFESYAPYVLRSDIARRARDLCNEMGRTTGDAYWTEHVNVMKHLIEYESAIPDNDVAKAKATKLSGLVADVYDAFRARADSIDGGDWISAHRRYLMAVADFEDAKGCKGAAARLRARAKRNESRGQAMSRRYEDEYRMEERYSSDSDCSSYDSL
jgi:hypothetical protein